MEKTLNFIFSQPEIQIAKNYIFKSLDEIGHGAFGKLYTGTNSETKESVAIKLELPNLIRSQLMIEYKIYSILKGGSK
jgi:serine/threonine protein kinase